MTQPLLHKELRDAGIAFREGRLSIDEYEEKLVPFFVAHFSRMGLSEDAFRSWAYDPDPALYSRVQEEFKKPGLSEGWIKLRRYMIEHAGRSHAFVPPGEPSRKSASGKITPTFSTLVWRYYRRRGYSNSNRATVSFSEAVFYTPPPSGSLRKVIRPWV